MKVENLETAARFAVMRRDYEKARKLLTDYVSSAEITIYAGAGFNADDKSVVIKKDTFNALMVKLIESEIAAIDQVVEQL